ncbi:hypothetical protein BDQ17DRAFT_1243921, partial [Cyathus striatus]
ETLSIIPFHGIQLTTCYHYLPFRLGNNRQFIPYSRIRDVVINETLSCWNVKFYLAIITSSHNHQPALHIAFPVGQYY